MKKKGKMHLSLSISIIFVILISSIGCIENSGVTTDVLQNFSITNIQIDKGILDGTQWLINVSNISGFFIESYNISENKTSIKPDKILQLQTLLYLIESTDQDEQVLNIIDKQINNYFSIQNITENVSYHDSIFTETALSICILDKITLHNNYQNLSKEKIETLKQVKTDQIDQKDFINCSTSSFKNMCLSLSSLIQINQNRNNTFDDDSLFFIYEMLLERLQTSKNDPEYLELVPYFTQTIYDLFSYTNDINLAQKHIEFNTRLLLIQNVNNMSRRGHFFIESNNQIDTTFTALCMKSIIQAYHLTDIIENETLKNSFELVVFRGMYAMNNMQETTIKQPFLYGGVYIDNNHDLIKLNSTLYTLQSFKQIKDLYINSSWTYISDGTQGYLSVKVESQNQNILWYLLSLGVIISIVFLVVLYLILLFIRKRKK